MTEEEARKVREKFKNIRIRRLQGYSDPLKAMQKREELLKAQAYPEPGAIWSKFKNIAMFNPQAAEELTSKEYDIRQLPYRGIAEEREATEAAREKMLAEQEKLFTKLQKEQEKMAIERERERVLGVKSRAQQELWRESHPEWDERRVRLELRKRNQLRFYQKPEVSKQAEGTNWIDKIKGLLSYIT